MSTFQMSVQNNTQFHIVKDDMRDPLFSEGRLWQTGFTKFSHCEFLILREKRDL